MSKHPGHLLADNFMAPLELTANQLATALGMNRSTVGRLIAGESRMSREMAARLGVYFQVPAKWWLLMQTEYDAEHIDEHPELAGHVTPLALAPDVMLTPTGVYTLPPAEASPPPISLSSSELEQLPEAPSTHPREVRTVRYDSGALALVGVDP